MADRFLVTGALGCIGAWVVRQLVSEGTAVRAFDRAGDPYRLEMLLTPEEMAAVEFRLGDVTNQDDVTAAFDGVTHVVHLAALQIPFCRADPAMGALVNVVGTVHVFEAAKRAALAKPIAYASSIGMFDAADADAATHRLELDAVAHPTTLYGVYKQANEGTARVYWSEHAVPSVGLRPLVVFGPGRDQGLTSGTTKAMAAAAIGRPYHIGFGGRTLMQFAPDVAAMFVAVSRSEFRGAAVHNVGGAAVAVQDVVDAIAAQVPGGHHAITAADRELPLPADVDSSSLTALIGPMPATPLAEAVATTMTAFRSLHERGRLPERAYSD